MKASRLFVLTAALFALGGNATAQDVCDRACLTGFVDAYFTALDSGDDRGVPLARNARITLNSRRMDLEDTFWSNAGEAIYRWDIVNERLGDTGTEAIVLNDDGTKTMMMLRLRVANRAITEVEIIRANQGDADGLWGPDRLTEVSPFLTLSIREADQDSYYSLIAAAEGYWRAFQTNGSALYHPAPLLPDAQRFENGLQTTGLVRNGRYVSTAEGFDQGRFATRNLWDRRYPVVDTERGIVLSIVRFGTKDGMRSQSATTANDRLVAEFFAVKSGMIQEVHAVLFNLPDSDPTGWDPDYGPPRGGWTATAMGQAPASNFDRGSSLQAWQDARFAEIGASCSNPPAPFGIGGGGTNDSVPPMPELPTPAAIPGVIAADQHWTVVWSWEGNNADGLIAGDDGRLLFANNDASNVMELDPSTGLARVIHGDGNTAGAVSRSSNGALYLATRGIGTGIEQLEPTRRTLASSFDGEPLECVGGVMNDLVADSRGGVYFSVTGAGVFYADSDGSVSRYGNVPAANGIILSPDEETLYATNGGELVAFDVESDGSLTDQRVFGQLRGGQGGDGSAVDEQGRVYVATGRSADVFSPEGEFLGSIAGPQGMHGVAFGGRDKKTLYGIVFYGAWGTQSARNAIVAIPMLAQGYSGRAK